MVICHPRALSLSPPSSSNCGVTVQTAPHKSDSDPRTLFAGTSSSATLATSRGYPLIGPHRVTQLKVVHLKAVMVGTAVFSNGTTCKATILLQLPDFALKFRFILKAIVTG